MSRPVNPYAVPAVYEPQKLARMVGNIFIEALPRALSDAEVLNSLSLEPDFSTEQRQWDNHLRVQQVKSLANFMVPLDRHLELARMLDTMLREGYVGRGPRTKEFVEKLQNSYLLQKEGKTFTQAADTIGSQDSAALIGVPGMGKSTTARRWLAQYPRVIVHEDMDVVQVTYIHVDMSSDGASVKALAIAIISQLDQLLPEYGYHKLYLQSTGHTSTESLIHTAARLLTIHHVGLLVADEVQNLAGSPKGAQTVMTELVTMCNTLNVPILFIGTNKASKVLGVDLRSARRAIGGFGSWGPMPRFDAGESVPGTVDEDSEWARFVQILWLYQWVREPIALTKDMLDYLYSRTQGIIDLVIKLFAIAQVRAIVYNLETLSEELLEQVYQEDFKLLHEAIDAMANGDAKAYEKFADVRPLDFEGQVQQHQARARSQILRARSVKPNETGFVETVATGLVALGFSSEDAVVLASKAQDDGKAKNPLEAVAQIAKEQRPSSLRLPSKPTGKAAEVLYPDFSSRPHDYRRATAAAAKNGSSIINELKALGMVRKAEELVPLD